MRIELLYFGVLKDLLGRDRETMELADGLTVADAIRLLHDHASNRQNEIWVSLAVAVNREYAGIDAVLHDADELALLPPVSGGVQ